MICIIAAHTKNSRIIGARGKIPWALPSEMVHFRECTSGNTVIFGRKTFESIGMALPNRTNIVVTKSRIEAQNVITVNSVEKAVKAAREYGQGWIFVCGGESIYRYVLEHNLAQRMIISEIPEEKCNPQQLAQADTFFPEIDLSKWKVENIEEREDFTIKTYIRM